MTVAPAVTTTAATAATRIHRAAVRDPRLGRELLRVRRARELHALLESRPDLAGSYGPADFAADGLRWTV